MGIQKKKSFIRFLDNLRGHIDFLPEFAIFLLFLFHILF